MYIFFYISILLCIIGLGFFFNGVKKQKQQLNQLQKKYKAQLENENQQLIDKNKKLKNEKEKFELERDAARASREAEAERFEEIRSHSNALLAAEKTRFASELKHFYDSKLQDLNDNFLLKQAEIEAEISKCQNELYEFQSIQKAVNEAIRRKKEIEEKEDFYSINISTNDQEDIQVLQSMDIRLHNRDVIPKLVWELFIRRPTQEMIKRVAGTEKCGGIYKITYKKTGESYIGKTTDFQTRWTNHIKTAIGLEAAARATLHNRMVKDGIWNYTFEILEKVDKESLSQRESYYINLYGTKQQLNMKEGNK